MQRFIRPKVILTLFLVFAPNSATLAFDKEELRTGDTYPPPLHVGNYGPDSVGFHFDWATDAEIKPATGSECYHLNRATYGLLNNSNDPLVFRWDDAWRWSTKTYPLRRGDEWDIPTTARGFRLIAPSEIRLGQSLNHPAQGAAYVPIQATKPECEGEQQSSPPSLKSTMTRDILSNNEPAILVISIESLPVIEGDLVSAVENIITVSNLEGTSIGLSSLPTFLGRVSESARASNIESISKKLSEYGASYTQSTLRQMINESELTYAPENLHNLDYGFVTLGEATSVRFSLSLESVSTPLEEVWFSVVAVDADGSVLTNGLASAWIPMAQ